MAVRIDALSDRLSRTTNLPSLNSFTIMAWVQLVSDRNIDGGLIAIGNGSNQCDYATAGDGTTTALWGGIANGDSSGTNLAVGTWYHVCLTGNGSTLLGYTNGVNDTSCTQDLTGAASTLYIGTDIYNEWCNVRVAAIKIWDAVLTASEILQEMWSVVPQRLSSINGWYPCFAGATERLADYSGNGRNFTAGGTLTDEDGPGVSWDLAQWFTTGAPGGGSSILFSLAVASESTTNDSVLLGGVAGGGSSPVVEQTTTGSGAAASSFTLGSWTPSANDLVLVFVAIRQDTITVSGISGNGITFASVGRIAGTQGQEAIECWRGQTASPTTGQITVTLSGSATAAVAVAHRISGTVQGSNGSTAIQGSATADTGATDTTAPSVNIATGGANRLVLGGVSHRNRTFSVGSGETALSLNNAAGAGGDETRLSTEYQAVASSSTVTIDGSLNTANDWTIIAVAVIPGGASISFALAVSSLSSTPDTVVAGVARALALVASSQSSTPDVVVAAVARAVAVAVSSLSSTPDTVVGGVGRALALAAASSSSTPDTVAAAVARALALGVSSGSTSGDIAMAVARALALGVSSSSSTGDIAMTVAGIISFALAVASQSSTPAVGLAVARALALGVSSLSSAPDTVVAGVTRGLALGVSSLSSAPDTVAVGVARALILGVSSGSTTPNIAMTVAGLIDLALTVASQSSTPAVALGVARSLALGAVSLSSTPNTVGASVARALALASASQSSTPADVDLLVARGLVLASASQSSTPLIDLDFASFLAALLDHVFSIFPRRWSFVVVGVRTISVPAARRSFEAHLMAVAEVPKDPGEELDYQFDYASLLGDDTILSSAWTADSGDVVVGADEETTTTTTVRVTGGTLGTKSKIKNTVTTASGQVLVRRLVIVLQEM